MVSSRTSYEIEEKFLTVLVNGKRVFGQQLEIATNMTLTNGTVSHSL